MATNPNARKRNGPPASEPPRNNYKGSRNDTPDAPEWQSRLPGDLLGAVILWRALAPRAALPEALQRLIAKAWATS
jgi:hypothetical protein